MAFLYSLAGLFFHSHHRLAQCLLRSVTVYVVIVWSCRNVVD